MSAATKSQEWKVSRVFKSVGSGTTPKSGDPEYYDNGTVSWLITGDLNDGEVTSTSRRITTKALSDYSTLKTYPENSLVIAMYGATIAKLGLLKISTTVNQACCVLIPSGRIDPKYAFYYFLASKQKLIDLGSGGGQPNISQDTIRSFKISVPELDKQRKMVNLLDTKTQTLSKIMTAKNHIHTHLSELRQAIIAELVYPSGGRTMNGVDQLYRHLASQESGTWGEDPNGLNEVRCLRVADFDYEHLSHKEPKTIRSIAPAHLQTKILQSGDVLIEKSGGGEKTPVGRAILVGKLNGPTTYANFIDRLRFKGTVLPEYAMYLLCAMYAGGVNTKYIKQNTGIQNLDIKHYLMEPVNIPNITKQKVIVERIKERLGRIEAVSNQLSSSIGYLEEYRSSLISNVVGGKVEV